MNKVKRKQKKPETEQWPSAESLEISRREFLALLSSSSAAAVLAACNSTDSPSPSSQVAPISAKPSELIYASATALAKAIRAKQVSSAEVVNAHLQRIEAVNSKLNAIVQLAAEAARVQAREADTALARGESKGPLHGVPITIKDNIETAGTICTSGTKGRASFVPTQDATVVARLRAAGAIVLGKSNLPEIGLGVETDNLVYGRTNNPYDPSRISGGSSGGEAAIIAAGGSPLGLGNDGGESIRSPSHFCGIAGIKPTSGRVPRTGHFRGPGGPLDAVWQPGPMARFMEDLILTLPIMAGVDGHDPAVVPMLLSDPRAVTLKSLRVAFYTQLPLTFDQSTLAVVRKTTNLVSGADSIVVSPTPETAETVRKVAKVLADAGMAVEEDRPPGSEQSLDLWYRLSAADGGAGLKMFLQMIGTTEVHPIMQSAFDTWPAYAMSTTEFIGWIFRWDMFRSAMLSFMDKYDVILCPVNAYPAPPHGISFDTEKFPGFVYPITYNLTGSPAVVVRGGTSPEGLSIGVRIMARPWREDVALAVAQHIETALDGWQRPPL